MTYESGYICPKCKRWFGKKFPYDQHRNACKGAMRCVCGATFMSSHSLREHAAKCHAVRVEADLAKRNA